MNYEKEIIRVLIEAGRSGLSVRKISMHVFNAHNGFFDTLCFEEVSKTVYAYLLRNSRNSTSIIEKTDKRGVYRLNRSSKRTRELLLSFGEDDGKCRPDFLDDTTSCQDDSLSLFTF